MPVPCCPSSSCRASPQASFLEWPSLLSGGHYAIMLHHPAHFLAAAVAGFGVNMLAILVIQLASSLTLKVRSMTLHQSHALTLRAPTCTYLHLSIHNLTYST